MLQATGMKLEQLPAHDLNNRGQANALVEISPHWMQSMLKEEALFMPKYPFTFHEESQINERMRAKLLAWLNEVHLKFKLLPGTLFMTVNLVDRFSQKAPITRSEY